MNSVIKLVSHSAEDTVLIGEKVAQKLPRNSVVAMFGSMGMGKTAFTHGLAKGLGIDPAIVSSPTFALVHEHGDTHKLYHFDMYRISTWDDLYSTGYFDYLQNGGILAVEWSENIENALPEDAVRVYFEQGKGENQRVITIYGGPQLENSIN